MAFFLSSNATAMSCTAGEPIVFSFQHRSTSGVVEDFTDKEFLLFFYDSDVKNLIPPVEGVVEHDDTGAYVYFALEGDVSASLYQHSPFNWMLAEDLDSGIDDIRSGKFTIAKGPTYPKNSNIAPMALYHFRVIRTNDLEDVVTAPRFTSVWLPYRSSSVVTPPVVPTLDNTLSDSDLLPSQVAGAHELFQLRETRLAALENILL